MYQHLTTSDLVAVLNCLAFQLDPKKVDFSEGHLCLLENPTFVTGFDESVTVHAYYKNGDDKELLMVTDSTGRVRPLPLCHLSTAEYDRFKALLLALHPATGLLCELLDCCRVLATTDEFSSEANGQKWQKSATRYNEIANELYDHHDELQSVIYSSDAWKNAKAGRARPNAAYAN